ncbi:hypothetical protein LINPERPRIM_LOCUS31928 [Linum perenne]
MAAAATLTLSLTPTSSSSDSSLSSSRHRTRFLLPHHFSTSHPSRFRFLIPKPSCSGESTTTATTTSASSVYSDLEPWLKNGTYSFLTNEELLKLKTLQDFLYRSELESGTVSVRVMRPEETDSTVGLLAVSFVESMKLPVWYLTLISFLVKQYLTERRAAIPHAVTLLGFYKRKEDDGGGNENEEGELAGTVEVSFNKRGVSDSPPTPAHPKDCPYICNMTVNKEFRSYALELGLYGSNCNPLFHLSYVFGTSRRRIGWNLLKASEELISQMTEVRDVYLHCRMIDSAPFNMYIKAGYNVVQTDSIFVLLLLQPRKHLMSKTLPVPTTNDDLELDMSGSDLEQVQVGS